MIDADGRTLDMLSLGKPNCARPLLSGFTLNTPLIDTVLGSLERNWGAIHVPGKGSTKRILSWKRGLLPTSSPGLLREGATISMSSRSRAQRPSTRKQHCALRVKMAARAGSRGEDQRCRRGRG